MQSAELTYSSGSAYLLAVFFVSLPVSQVLRYSQDTKRTVPQLVTEADMMMEGDGIDYVVVSTESDTVAILQHTKDGNSGTL